MTEQFKEQGGAATMDPSWFRRWFTSKFVTTVVQPGRLDKKRAAAEKKRIKQKAPHRVEYFHQVDDGYSHLAAQLLESLAARYDVELEYHLVHCAEGANTPEPELLSRLSRYDAFCVAPEYGLEFPQHEAAPNPDLVSKAEAILAAQGSGSFAAAAVRVGQALWADNHNAMEALAQEFGTASAAETRQRHAVGDARRAELKHYSAAMFYYAGEWYWGVDRLYHLEKRLAALGVDRQTGQALLAPRPEIEVGEIRDTGTLTLEVFASLRSPYTAIAFDRAVKLARDTGVKLSVRPVLPMVMRGVPATQEKGFYVFTDTAREAREAGVPFGNFFDPIGEPARRAYSIYPWAEEQGKGVELISSFLRHAFVEGVNTLKDSGRRQVVEAAGLDWEEARKQLGKPGWEAILEENRLAMYDAGLWGVPSFRLLNASGESLLALWGQDRLWLFAREIQRQLQRR